MRNVTGSPVEDDDFFDRPHDLRRLQRLIADSANILLTAPRRVGKTSLILRLCGAERQAARTAVYLNVEGCHDEITFAEKLLDGLRTEGLHPQLLPRVSELIRRLRTSIGGSVNVGAAGVDVGLDAAEDPEHSTLSRALESIFRRVEADGTPVLLAIDELPELLLGLGRQEHGAERVSRLLHWLRALRQTYRRQVRWVFLGSIGLDSFVDTRQLRKTINDLTPADLPPLTREEGGRFLAALGTSNDLPLPPAASAHLLARIGWLLPHHLQLVFHALRDSDVRQIDPAAIDAAIASLLTPAHLSQFDTWRQRLDEQLTATESAAAKAVLLALCEHPSGRTRDQIRAGLLATRPAADPGAIEEQLAQLLLVLQRDGYLHETDGRYAFRSFLLREYWLRRHLR